MEQAEVAATLRWFVSRSGVTHVVAATPAGTFGCDATGYVTVQADEADDPVEVARDAAAAAVALDVTPIAPGGMEHAAEAALSLSRALGAPTAVVVWLPTEDDIDLAISARDGEGVVVMLGDEEIEMEEGWPPPSSASGGGQDPGN
jgi:hypothetical protein